MLQAAQQCRVVAGVLVLLHLGLGATPQAFDLLIALRQDGSPVVWAGLGAGTAWLALNAWFWSRFALLRGSGQHRLDALMPFLLAAAPDTVADGRDSNVDRRGLPGARPVGQPVAWHRFHKPLALVRYGLAGRSSRTAEPWERASMMDETAMGVPLDSIAHIIQVALTPVFLLSAVGSLLNVITARLSRVADQADAPAELLRAASGAEAVFLHARLWRLHRRLRALDLARAFGAMAGAATCAATFALFLGGLHNAAVATALFLSFGTSVLFTMASLLGFFAEVLLSSRRTVPMLLMDRNAV